MRSIRLFAAIATFAPFALQAQAGQVVGPGGASTLGNPTSWNPSVQGGATIEVTKNNPRLGFGGYGSGSLEMSVSGQVNLNGQYSDWGFWYQYAGGSANSGQSFGSLSQLSALSFDWYRTSLLGWNAPVGSVMNSNEQSIPPADWMYKTPVMRVELRENRTGGPVYSELVWEGYYNKCSLGTSSNCENNITPVNTWVSQSGMQGGNFWYANPLGTANGSLCNNSYEFWAGNVQAVPFAGLSSACFGGVTVDVIGVAVGVGSQWPLPYRGFVDNVRMGFSEQKVLSVDANFDYVPSTVPEPSTYALMGAGLLAIGVVARRRRTPQQ